LKKLDVTSPLEARKASSLMIRHVARVSAHLAVALQAMNDQTAGYPSRASGSNPSSSGSPSSTDEDPVALTSVERAVLSGGKDEAAADIARLYGALSAAELNLSLAAEIVDRYSAGRTSPKDRLGAVDPIWCPNCAKHGHYVGRAENRSRCTFCDAATRANGFEPDGPMLMLHHQGRRLREPDIAAARARHAAAGDTATKRARAERQRGRQRAHS
jgi:hypothetical protein